jgi:F0F1-type ATP synthase epsilon subunit
MVVEVISPTGTVFKGGVEALSSSNEVGRFDLLPYHANFITIIKDSLVIRPSRGPTQTLPVTRGVLYCYNNNVTVYLGI